MTKRDWYTALISGLLFPLHERVKNHDSVSMRKALEVSQWWDQERLEEFQLARLRELLVEGSQG